MKTNDIKKAIVLLQGKAEGECKKSRRRNSFTGSGSKEFLKMVQLLLESGADINSRNAQGETTLFKAILFDRFKVVQLLLYRKIETKMNEEQIEMTLFYVSIPTSVELVQLLLTCGSSLSKVNDKGESSPFLVF